MADDLCRCPETPMRMSCNQRLRPPYQHQPDCDQEECPTLLSDDHILLLLRCDGQATVSVLSDKYMNRGFSARSSNSAAICGTNTLRTMRTASTEDAAHRGRQGLLLPVGCVRPPARRGKVRHPDVLGRRAVVQPEDPPGDERQQVHRLPQ